VGKERSVLALAQERECTRDILRRKSDLRKVDTTKIQSGNVNYSHAATGELCKGAGRGDQAMRASNYKMTTYKSISFSQGL